MLTIISSHEITLSKAAQERTWKAFKQVGTTHSGNAATLPYIIRRCEQERVPYLLMARPGIGYFIQSLKDKS